MKMDSHGYMCSDSRLSILEKRKIITFLSEKQLRKILYKNFKKLNLENFFSCPFP